jgi:hypothetical protein
MELRTFVAVTEEENVTCAQAAESPQAHEPPSHETANVCDMIRKRD